ncbi:MAG: hypothetical protein ABF310_08090 [Paracoccaceae bacterium]|jgi:hypothetical protein
MFAKVYHFEFADLADAKAAAAQLSREMSSAISEFDLAGISVFLNKTGHLTANIKFDELDLVKEFEQSKSSLIDDIARKYNCDATVSTALSLFAYEREAVSTDIGV